MGEHETPPDSLRRARIQRVDSPARGTLSLTLRWQGETLVLVLFGTPRGPDAGLLPERPRGSPANAFAQKLRRTIQNGRIEALEVYPGHALCLQVERGEHRATLVSLGQEPAFGFLLLGPDGLVMASSGLPDGPVAGESWAPPSEAGQALNPDDLREEGARRFAAESKRSADRGRKLLLKRIRSGRKRAERKAVAIQADIARVASVEELRREGQAILGALHEIRRGQTELEAMDWSTTPPSQHVISLRADTAAKVQAEERFHRARRLERGAQKAEERLRMAEAELERLIQLEARCRALGERDDDDDALQELAEEADAAGVRRALQSLAPSPPGGKRGRSAPAARTSFRRFPSVDGLQIWVGKGGADNDRLTLDHARPHDRWFHARGCPGAHVLVKLDRNQGCPPEALLDAATLAAHFSKLRGDPVVDVQHTERRYVRKPRGAGAGQVLIEREKVIAVRIESERLQRLLDSELRGER